MKRWLAAATLFVIAALSIVGLGKTATSAATDTYDARPAPRVGVHEFDAADASSIHLRSALEVSSSPSVEDRRTTTTPRSRSVATEAGINAEGGVGAAE